MNFFRSEILFCETLQNFVGNCFDVSEHENVRHARKHDVGLVKGGVAIGIEKHLILK